MANANVVTQKGYNKVLAEIEELRKVKRPIAVARLKKAREMGDLSENSEYVAAKEDLSFLDGRAQELEYLLRQVKVIPDSSDNSIIEVGSVVDVLVNGNKDTISIVGELEANIAEKKLSNNSPIGSALLGKKKGDVVAVTVPAGEIEYTILKIS
ncbi:MAG: transcription elongation factor GreA [Microgenomates group bacterium]